MHKTSSTVHVEHLKLHDFSMNYPNENVELVITGDIL